jgi:hypothetical protein
VARPRDAARRVGVEHYRSAFEGDRGRYILADLRRFCRADEKSVNWRALSEEQKADPQAFWEHIGRLQVYEYLRTVSEITDEQIDAFEDGLRRRFSVE